MAKSVITSDLLRADSSAYKTLYDKGGLQIYALKGGRFEIKCGTTRTYAHSMSEVSDKIDALELHQFASSGQEVLASINQTLGQQFRLEIKAARKIGGEGEEQVFSVEGNKTHIADKMTGTTNLNIAEMVPGRRYAMQTNMYGGDYAILVPMSMGMLPECSPSAEAPMYEKQPFAKGMVLEGIDPVSGNLFTCVVADAYPNGSFTDSMGKVFSSDDAELYQLCVAQPSVAEDNFKEPDEPLYESSNIPSYNPIGVVKEQAPQAYDLANYDAILSASAGVLHDFMKTAKKVAYLDRSSLNKVTVTAINDKGQATDGAIEWNVRIGSPHYKRSSQITIPMVMVKGSVDIGGEFITSTGHRLPLTVESLQAHLGTLAQDDLYRKASKETSERYPSTVKADKDIDALTDGIFKNASRESYTAEGAKKPSARGKKPLTRKEIEDAGLNPGEYYSDIIAVQEAIESSDTEEDAVKKLNADGFVPTYVPEGSDVAETVEETVARVWSLYKDPAWKEEASKKTAGQKVWFSVQDETEQESKDLKSFNNKDDAERFQDEFDRTNPDRMSALYEWTSDENGENAQYRVIGSKKTAGGESWSDVQMQQEAIEASETQEEAVQKLKDMGYESTFTPDMNSDKVETIEECVDRVWDFYKDPAWKEEASKKTAAGRYEIRQVPEGEPNARLFSVIDTELGVGVNDVDFETYEEAAEFIKSIQSIGAKKISGVEPGKRDGTGPWYMKGKNPGAGFRGKGNPDNCPVAEEYPAKKQPVGKGRARPSTVPGGSDRAETVEEAVDRVWGLYKDPGNALEASKKTAANLEEKSVEELEALIDNWMDAMAHMSDAPSTKPEQRMVGDRIREAEAILQRKKKEAVASKKTAAPSLRQNQVQMLADSFVSNILMYKEEIDKGTMTVEERAQEIIDESAFEGFPQFSDLNRQQISDLVQKKLSEAGIQEADIESALVALEMGFEGLNTKAASTGAAVVKTASAGPHTLLTQIAEDLQEGKLEDETYLKLVGHGMGHTQGADLTVGTPASDIMFALIGYEAGHTSKEEALKVIKNNIEQALADNEMFKGMTAQDPGIHELWMKEMDERNKGPQTTAKKSDLSLESLAKSISRGDTFSLSRVTDANRQQITEALQKMGHAPEKIEELLTPKGELAVAAKDGGRPHTVPLSHSIDVEQLLNKNLKLTLAGDDAAEELKQAAESQGDEGALVLGLEHWFGNGYELIAPEEVGALTDSLIIGYDTDRDDQGKLLKAPQVWWFPNYQVESPLQTLLEKGEVIFTYAEDREAPKAEAAKKIAGDEFDQWFEKKKEPSTDKKTEDKTSAKKAAHDTKNPSIYVVSEADIHPEMSDELAYFWNEYPNNKVMEEGYYKGAWNIFVENDHVHVVATDQAIADDIKAKLASGELTTDNAQSITDTSPDEIAQWKKLVSSKQSAIPKKEDPMKKYRDAYAEFKDQWDPNAGPVPSFEEWKDQTDPNIFASKKAALSDWAALKDAIMSSQTQEEAVKKLKDSGYTPDFIPSGSDKVEAVEETVARLWDNYKEAYDPNKPDNKAAAAMDKAIAEYAAKFEGEAEPAGATDYYISERTGEPQDKPEGATSAVWILDTVRNNQGFDYLRDEIEAAVQAALDEDEEKAEELMDQLRDGGFDFGDYDQDLESALPDNIGVDYSGDGDTWVVYRKDIEPPEEPEEPEGKVEASVKTAKSPKRWEKTVEKMKKHLEIDNPFALSRWMKEKGYEPKKGSVAVAAPKKKVTPESQAPVQKVALIYEINKMTQKDSLEHGVTGQTTDFGTIHKGVAWTVDELFQEIEGVTNIEKKDFVVFEDGRLTGNVAEDNDSNPVSGEEEVKRLDAEGRLYLSDYDIYIQLGDGSEPTVERLVGLLGISDYDAQFSVGQPPHSGKHGSLKGSRPFVR